MSNIPNEEAGAPNVNSPPKTWGNLKQRVVSAIILLPVGLGVLWLGGTPFAMMIALVSLLMAYEWHLLIGSHIKTPAFVIHALTILLAVVNMMFGNVVSVFLLVGLGALLAGLSVGIQDRKYLWIGFGVAYTIGAPILLIWLRDETVIGFLGVLAVVVAVVATDVGAYFAGKAIGGPKLVPSISPSKTWAGLIGGGLLAALISAGIASLFDLMPVWLGAIAGFILAVVSQMGDIMESSVKRYFNAKDSSHLIPGHGGVLDRFDGLLFAAVIVGLGTMIVRALL